jgi:hypothetical protein
VTTTPTLPIKSILATNPSRIRKELGSLQELEASIKQHGMIMPILLMPDFGLVDGARRLAVAQRLKWTTVPVKITDDWDEIIAYYKKSNEPEMLPELRLPMRWIELDWLWSVTLKQSAEKRRRFRIGAVRKANAAKRERGEKVTSVPYTDFVLDIVDMFPPARPSDVKTLRDTYRTLTLIQKTDPQYVKEVLAIVAEYEMALGIQYVSRLRQVLRNVRTGKTSKSESLEILQDTLQTAKYLSSKRPQQRASNPGSKPDRLAPAISLQTVHNLVQMLDQISWEATNFKNFEDLSEAFVKEVGQKIHGAVLRIRAMRRRLINSVETDSGEK